MKGRVSGFLVLLAVGAVALLASSAGSLAGSRAVSPFDAHWLKATAQGNLYEVAVGQAESPQVVKFARAMLPTLQKHLTAFTKLAKATPEKLSPTSGDESGSCPGH